MLSPLLLYYNTLVCKNVKAQGKRCNVNDIQLRRFQSMKRALLTAFHSSNEARHCGCYMFPTSRNWRGPARVSDLGHHSRAGDSNLKIHLLFGARSEASPPPKTAHSPFFCKLYRLVYCKWMFGPKYLGSSHGIVRRNGHRV